MSFRIQHASTGSSLALQLLSSYDLRYLLSLSLAYPVAPEVLAAFLEALYTLYPYNSKKAYQSFYTKHPLPSDTTELEAWVNELFLSLFGTVPLTFTTLPTASEWGPIYWRFLFAIADQDTDSELFSEVISNLLPDLLPCPTCQAHLSAYLLETPVSFPISDWLKAYRHSIKLLPIPTASLELSPSPGIAPLFSRSSKIFTLGASIQLPKDYVSKPKKCCGPRPS